MVLPVGLTSLDLTSNSDLHVVMNKCSDLFPASRSCLL